MSRNRRLYVSLITLMLLLPTVAGAILAVGPPTAPASERREAATLAPQTPTPVEQVEVMSPSGLRVDERIAPTAPRSVDVAPTPAGDACAAPTCSVDIDLDAVFVNVPLESDAAGGATPVAPVTVALSLGTGVLNDWIR